MQAQLNNNPPNKRAVLNDLNFQRVPFPNFDFLRPAIPSHDKRQNTTVVPSPLVVASFATYGPLFTRMISQSVLQSPMFAITLQRDAVDIGGNVGLLSIGELPAGIPTTSLTWVPLREYPYGEGGVPPPPDAPNEVGLYVVMLKLAANYIMSGIPAGLGNRY